MDRFLMDRCLPRLRCAVAAFALFAGSAAADNNTPPQLVRFSISPLSVDTSAGPATLNITITAQDLNNGFGSNVAGNGSISLALQSGNTIFSRQSLPMTGGTSTNPVFQFGFTLPQFSPSGVYSIGITLVDNASNTSIFNAASLQALGFPSAITVTNGAFGSLTLSPSTADVPAFGGFGSLSVTASNSGFAWSAVSNASWLTIASGASGTGNGTITYLAAMNSSSTLRTGIITVGGQTFTAIQAPANSALNTTAGSLQFAYQVGGAAPPPQTITAYSSGAPLNFTAAASSVGNWLFVSPSNGVTSTILSIFVNPIGLATGVYSGSVTVTANGSSNGSQTEAVTLTVGSGSGPTVTATPVTLSFSYQQGGSPAPAQSVAVTAGAPTGFTASASSTGGWLAVVALGSTTPSALTVSISALGLAPGNYSGSVVISTAAGVQTIPVTLVVAASSAIAVIPSSLTFSYALGGAVPLPQSLLFSGGIAGSSFTATASSAGNWLTLGGLAAPAPGGVNVSINPSGLGTGVYAGTITVTEAGVAQQNVPVTLIITALPGFTVSPSSLTFSGQSGVASRGTQFLNLTANDPSATFTATPSTNGQSWLVLSATGPFQAGQLGVSVNSFNLLPGTYVGHITVIGASSSQVVPVTLIVAGVGSVAVSPSSLQINYQVGDPNPSAQPFSLSGSATTFTASASGTANWLAVNPTSGGSVPGTLSALVSPAGLAPGLYTGIIAIFPAGAAMQTVTISLNVYAPQNLTLSPSVLSFAYQTGGSTPASQTITVACAGSALSFRPAASSLGNWLSSTVPNALGNNQIIVSVNPAGLTPNSYTGTITIVGVGACNTTQTVPVTLVVSGAPQALTTSGGSLVFSYQAGGGFPAAQSVPIGCPGVVSPFTASSNSGWLHVNPASGVTPASLNISADPTGLTAGSYAGIITIYISAACGGNQIVNVALVVGAAQPVTASGLTFGVASLSFTANSGASAPPQQTVSLSCSGSAAQFLATATSNGGWLFVSPSGGTTPGTLAVSVNPGGLAAGSYAGSINAAASSCGAAPALPVTLTVNPAPAPVTNPSLTISPGSLTFAYQAGGANPADQTLLLTVSGGTSLAFTASASSAGWLSVNPLGGSAPVSLVVAVNPAGLLAGTYSGVILIATSTGAAGSSQNIAVRLTVSTPPPPPVTVVIPVITSIVNGASLLPSPLAPGEIISFFGRGLGPTDSASFLLTAAGLVDKSLAGTRVIIDGTPAPMLYTQAGQVNAIVPYSVAGKSTVQVQLEYQGIRSAPASFVVADAAPAIFSIDGSGRGQGAILDQDTSVNSDLNPADRGSIVVLYASGAGQMAPSIDDGAITGTEPAKPVALVSVLVDGQDTQVISAGAAPGLVAGMLQVNFRLPQQVRTGAAIGILLKVGRFTSQPGVTLAIR